MSKIVSVTRILNEDDIVEAFVRHNAVHVDHMLFLDNGSTDRTLEILRALQAEGFPLTVFQSFAISFDEIATNSWSYQVASQILGAGWVVYLDADEFIATPDSMPLAGPLAGAFAGAHNAVTAQLVNYVQTREDNADEPVLPWRQRWRQPGETGVVKLMLRANLPQVTVEAGNHGAFSNGQKLPAAPLVGVTLAHYPRRNGWQIVQKMCAGWLKAVAAGRNGMQHSRHYLSPFETIRDKPGEVFFGDYFKFELSRLQAVEEPLAYLGGPLVYWQKTDPAMKAAQIFLHFAERLALQHGRLIDEAAPARALVDSWNAKREFLF